MKADARLGGHFVQGHVDATATVKTIDTLEVTTLGEREVGHTVNIEADMLGKYIYKMVSNLGLTGEGNQAT